MYSGAAKGAKRNEMRMNRTIKVAATLTVAGVLALTGCGGDSDGV